MSEDRVSRIVTQVLKQSANPQRRVSREVVQVLRSKSTPNGHRYWRFTMHRSSSGAGYMGMTELVYRSFIGGGNILGEATLTTNVGIQAGSLASLYDGQTNTFAQWGSVSGVSITADFGAGNEKVIAEVGIMPNKDDAQRSPAFWSLSWSDDNVSWVLHTWGRNSSWTLGTTVYYQVPPKGVAKRHWGLFVTSTVDVNGATSIGELELCATAGGVDETAGKQAGAYSSPNYGGLPASMAFDDDTTTLWGADNEWKPSYIGIDLGAGNERLIQYITVTSRNVDPWWNQTPTSGWVCGSVDGRTFSFEWAFSITFTGNTQKKTATNPAFVPVTAHKRRVVSLQL